LRSGSVHSRLSARNRNDRELSWEVGAGSPFWWCAASTGIAATPSNEAAIMATQSCRGKSGQEARSGAAPREPG